jgi:hypothetical protein
LHYITQPNPLKLSNVNIINISGSKNLKNRCQGSGDGLRFLKPDSTYIPSTNLIFIFDSLWIEYLYLYFI